jgi:hypothetical protein
MGKNNGGEHKLGRAAKISSLSEMGKELLPYAEEFGNSVIAAYKTYLEKGMEIAEKYGKSEEDMKRAMGMPFNNMVNQVFGFDDIIGRTMDNLREENDDMREKIYNAKTVRILQD